MSQPSRSWSCKVILPEWIFGTTSIKQCHVGKVSWQIFTHLYLWYIHVKICLGNCFFLLSWIFDRAPLDLFTAPLVCRVAPVWTVHVRWAVHVRTALALRRNSLILGPIGNEGSSFFCTYIHLFECQGSQNEFCELWNAGSDPPCIIWSNNSCYKGCYSLIMCPIVVLHLKDEFLYKSQVKIRSFI